MIDTVQIQTQMQGQIAIDPRQIFTFPFGLYAFEALRSFALLDSTHAPFYWLQSLERRELAFLIIKPDLFLPHYRAESTAEEDLESVSLQGFDDPNLLILNIVTLGDGSSTVNLQGPVLLNKEQNLGRQVILTDERWSVRFNLEDLQEECLEMQEGRV